MGQFVVSNPLSVIDNILDENIVNIYPNPSNGDFTIEVKLLPLSITVTDLLGRLIETKEQIDGNLILFKNLPAGINIITLEYDGTKITKKVMVK